MYNWYQGNYYIAFVVLTNALEGYFSRLHYLNLVLNYFYLGLPSRVSCFHWVIGHKVPSGHIPWLSLGLV